MIGAVASALGREVKVYVSPAAIQGGEPTGTSRRPDGNKTRQTHFLNFVSNFIAVVFSI